MASLSFPAHWLRERAGVAWGKEGGERGGSSLLLVSSPAGQVLCEHRSLCTSPQGDGLMARVAKRVAGSRARRPSYHGQGERAWGPRYTCEVGQHHRSRPGSAWPPGQVGAGAGGPATAPSPPPSRPHQRLRGPWERRGNPAQPHSLGPATLPREAQAQTPTAAAWPPSPGVGRPSSPPGLLPGTDSFSANRCPQRGS